MNKEHRVCRWQRAIVVTVLVVLALTFQCPAIFALDDPPTCTDATWWGQVWGTVNISQKIINYGDTVTITATLGPAAPSHPDWVCAWGNWATQGTFEVKIFVPSACFDILDYSPKGDRPHKFAYPDSSGVRWTAVAEPAPNNWVWFHCYCENSPWGQRSWDDCGSGFHPQGVYKEGDTFTVTLKAKCSGNDPQWSTSSAHFAGMAGGISAAYDADDYYKFGGQMSVSLTANPTSLPADGSRSLLLAHVTESSSNVSLPRQAVNFTREFGLLVPTTALTDSLGNAAAAISSYGEIGPDLVAAYVKIGTSTAQTVTFTYAPQSQGNSKNRFGRGLSDIGEPVNAGLGNYIFSKQLFAFPGKGLPLAFQVNYNSLDNTYSGPLGYGWTHTFNVVLTPPTPPSTDVTIKWGDGREDTFHGDGSGNFTPINSTTPVTLTMPDPSQYLATLQNRNTYQFDSNGRLLAISDLNGNQIVLTYSATTPNQVDHITDTAGRQIDFVYDVSGHITAVTSPLKAGNTVSFQYDGSGDLTGIVDPRGKTWGFTYDGSHRILTHIDAKGVTVVTNAYDAQGRVSQQTDGANHVTTYAYTVDASGTTTVVTPPSGNAITQTFDLAYNLTSATDGEGNQGTFYTDPRGRLSRATDKKGGAVQIQYDDSSNPSFAQDRAGATSQFAYNAQNRPTSITDPLGHTSSLGYDANGNLTSTQNALGFGNLITVNASGQPLTITRTGIADLGTNWSYTYDGNGLPQTVTDPLGAQTSFTHDSAGRVTQLNLPVSGATVQATYDEAGNMLTRTDPLGHVTSFTYDDNGDLTAATFVPTGATTTYSYGWSGHPLTVTDALGGVTTYSYDVDGNLASVTDPDGIIITRQYDKANRLKAVVDFLGHHVYYGYDTNGNVTSVKNENGDTWTTTFDAEGRPLQGTDPLGNKSTAVYDAAGRVISKTDPLGNTTAFQYDAINRVTSTTLPDQGVIQLNYDYLYDGKLTGLTDPLGRSWGFEYDPDGRVVDWSDPDGQTEYDGHDPLGRLTQKTLRDGTIINYGYDADSRLTSVSMPPGQTITYAYDAAGNPTSITDPSGTTTMTYDELGRRLTRTDASNKTIAFTYTAAGRVKTMTYPGSNVVTYAYDAAGRLSTISDWRGNQTSFQYDSVNRITQATLPNNTRTSYTYDAAGRVVARVSQKSDSTVLASYTYAYDAAGHITSVQRTEPTTPAFVDSSAKYTYDPVNRVLTANVDGVATTYAFDLKGDLITKTSAAGTTSYTFDALNRLASVSDGTNTTTYTYDGAGNRLAKTFNGATVGYVREGGTIYCTLDGSGNVQSYNVYAGSLLYSLDAAGTIKVYHGDERGSIVAITDASQNVVQSYSYDPYGKVLGASGSLANAFRYVGAYGVMADEDGLYHMQARYYDPDARRFISEDPLGLSAGLNLYGYTGGDPVNRTDPTGQKYVMAPGGGYQIYVPDDPPVVQEVESVVPEVESVVPEVGSGSFLTQFSKRPVFKPLYRYRMTNNDLQEAWDEIHTRTYGRRFVPISGNGELRIQGRNWGGVTPGKEIDVYQAQGKFVANYEGAETALEGGVPAVTEADGSLSSMANTIAADETSGITVGGVIADAANPVMIGYTVWDLSFQPNSLVTDTDGKMIPKWMWDKEHVDPYIPKWMSDLNALRVKINAKVNPYNPVLWPIYIGEYIGKKAYNYLDNAFPDKKTWQQVRELNE